MTLVVVLVCIISVSFGARSLVVGRYPSSRGVRVASLAVFTAMGQKIAAPSSFGFCFLFLLFLSY